MVLDPFSGMNQRKRCQLVPCDQPRWPGYLSWPFTPIWPEYTRETGISNLFVKNEAQECGEVGGRSIRGGIGIGRYGGGGLGSELGRRGLRG